MSRLSIPAGCDGAIVSLEPVAGRVSRRAPRAGRQPAAKRRPVCIKVSGSWTTHINPGIWRPRARPGFRPAADVRANRRWRARLDRPRRQTRPRRVNVEVVESYFGADGRPIKRKSLGAARIARSYDRRGNQVEEAYYNTDGKPTPRKGLGAARIHWRYDDSGNKVEAEFFGPDGALLSRENADEPPEPAPELA